jgi:uncharacterized protein
MDGKREERHTSIQLIGLGIGLFGGSLGGLLGLGGAVVMIPLMTWLTRITQLQAHGTSLVAVVFGAFTAAATYLAHGDADWKISIVLALSAIVTARFGALFAHSLPDRKLKKAFGFFLIFASLMLLIKGSLPSLAGGLPFWARTVVYAGIGSLTGFVSGMLGVGGGGVMVPLIVIFGGMEQHLAQGTSLLAMVPASMSGAYTHYKLGNVKTGIVMGLVVGTLVGGYLGATAAAALGEVYLRAGFSCLGFWMGIRYLRI